MRALTALVVLGGLIAGIPWALLTWSEWPITSAPTWEQVKDLPTTAVSDQAIVTVMVVALWALWAVLLVSIIAELFNQARSAQRPSINIGGPIQRMVGSLLGSVVMGLVSTPAAGALAGPPALPAAVVAPADLPEGPAASPANYHSAVGVARPAASADAPRLISPRPFSPAPLPVADQGTNGGEVAAPPPAAAPTAGPWEPAELTEADSLPTGVLHSGVSLVGVLLLLERRRRARQRGRSLADEVILPAAELQPYEAALRAGADVAGAEMIDATLRAVSAGVGAAGLPAIRWMEATPDRALLAVAEPAPPPPGFRAAAADQWETAASVEELTAIGGQAPVPLPALVPVGVTEDGSELLVDLESSGVVSVGGDRDKVHGLLRALAIGSSTVPWAEPTRVVVVGLGGELLDLPWVESSTLAGALDFADDHVRKTSASLRRLGCSTMMQARAAGNTSELWESLAVISVAPPDDADQRARVATLAERAAGAVAVVLPALDDPGVSRRLTIDEDGWLHIEGVDVLARPRLLDDSDAAAVVALLDMDDEHRYAPVPAEVGPSPARGLVSVSGRGGLAVPGGPGSASGPDGLSRTADDGRSGPEGSASVGLAALIDELDVAVVVQVLGEVGAVRYVAGQPEELAPSRQKALEAIAYLALRETPPDREALEISLFPDGANAAKTMYNTISGARALVGEELFPRTGGRYELSRRVLTDYGLFCELVARAHAEPDAALATTWLSDALLLIRGEPFTGVGRGYAWVGPHRGMMVARVIDAAEELAQGLLDAGEWRTAEWAARQGLRAFPADERMYRLLMRTARAAGNIPGVQRVFRELCQVIADPDIGVEPEDTLHPETVQLLEDLTT